MLPVRIRLVQTHIDWRALHHRVLVLHAWIHAHACHLVVYVAVAVGVVRVKWLDLRREVRKVGCHGVVDNRIIHDCNRDNSLLDDWFMSVYMMVLILICKLFFVMYVDLCLIGCLDVHLPKPQGPADAETNEKHNG